jgi:hypothetical protein
MNATPASRACLLRNSPVAHPAAATSPSSTHAGPEIFEVWDEWASKAMPFERRLAAVSAVRVCIENEHHFLDLSFLGLTSLPPCIPPHISELDVSSNKLRVLPDTLPPFLNDLEASNNKLQELSGGLPKSLERICAAGNRLVGLPPTLPDRLRYLRLSQNRIENLPASLPVALETLLVDGNNLVSLPAHLPASLAHLNASSNRLGALPQLPDSLRTLRVDINQLEELPAKLPADLRTIGIDQNKIRALPAELPPALENLSVCFNRLTKVPVNWPPNLRQALFRGNQIAELPEEIFSIPLETQLLFEENPLAEETHARLSQRVIEAQVLAENVSFQRRKATALIEAVCLWFPSTQHAVAGKLWGEIAAEQGAEQFARFLRRLSRTPNLDDAEFRAKMANWLLLLPQSTSVREATFMIAFDAAETCEDRAALALNHMWAAGFVSHAQEGVYDSDIPRFIHRARLIFRLELLANKAREKADQVHRRHESSDVDEISIYLGYEVKLNEDLLLESPIHTMRFFDASRISQEDLVAVWLEVMEHENAQFASWLSCWSPWEGMLERQDPGGYEEMQKDLHREVADPQFQNNLATALREVGLEDDEDAKRLRGPMVMKKIEQDIKLPFTRDFLTSRNHLSLLDHFWSDVGASYEALRKRMEIAEILDR